MTGLRFADPAEFLWLLLLPVFWRIWRGPRARTDTGGRAWRAAGARMRARRMLALWLRLIALALLIGALSTPQTVTKSDDLQVTFVVDRSRSIPAASQVAIERSLADATSLMGPDDLACLIVFGAGAHIESRPSLGRIHGGQITSVVSGDLTNVEAGLRLAMTSFADGVARRIVLISDGNENRGSMLEIAALAAANGVQIDVVPIRYEYPREVFVEKIVLPERVKFGQPFILRTVVHSTVAGKALLSIYENERPLMIGRDPVDMEIGKNVFFTRLHFQDEETEEAARKGFYVYEARVTLLDEAGQPDPLDQPSNNRALGFTQVSGRPVVLLVDGNDRGGEFLDAALSSQGILVKSINPAELPQSIVELQGYDCIILSNIGAESFTQAQLTMLRSSVRDVGTGLVMVGGEKSFGAGGWLNTPVEEVLPVSMEIKEEKILPNGALCCIMHTCEFDNGNVWAKDITIAAMDVLSAKDYFGVVYYPSRGGNCTWGTPGGMINPTDKAGLRKIIRNQLDPGDMPDFDNAFFVAEAGLAKVDAALKHIIVISDGDPTPPSIAVINRIINQKITVSAIAIAPHGGGTIVLQNLCKTSGGKFYATNDPRQLPRIFIHEAQVVRRAVIVEKSLPPELVQVSEPVLGVVEEGMPTLHGYVATSAKPLATVALSIDGGMPLFAHWRHGLGRTAAFTSDAKDRWAKEWTSWRGFPKFWGQVVRWCQKSVSDSDFQVRAEVANGKAKIQVDAIDDGGRFENGLVVRATVISASGESVSEVELLQTAPGHYEGEAEASLVGAYLVNLRSEKSTVDEAGNPIVETSGQTAGFSVPYSPEFRQLAANVGILTQVAEMTGGQVLEEFGEARPIAGTEYDADNPYHVFRKVQTQAMAPVDRWQWLVLAATILFVLDIIVRRVVFDPARLMRPIYWLLPVLGRAQRRAVAEAEKLIETMKRPASAAPTSAAAPARPAWLEPDKQASGAGQEILGDKQSSSAPAAGADAGTEEASYTSRLLDAKRRARQDRKKK